MKTRYSLRLAAELENLVTIRNFVQESAAALGIDPAAVFDVLLASDEAATNVIVHGYQGQPGMIEIEMEREAMDVVIRVRDNAPPFDPTQAPLPDLTRPLEERRPGGLGIYLIRHSVDQVIHRITPEGGNELILRKRIAIGEREQ